MKKITLKSCKGGLNKLLIVTLVAFALHTEFAYGSRIAKNSRGDTDTSVNAFIRRYLGINKSVLLLHYPKSVMRFYTIYGQETAWVCQSNTRQTWQAMMLLDCVLQYGLSPADYHPEELLYEPLHTMIEEPAKISNAKKAKFDILLTDALIALMNNLHFGKLNPEFSNDRIDEGLGLSFHAETALLSAKQQPQFIAAIESAQPHSKQYSAMQDKLRQLRGVYKADCYQTPEAEVTKIAINMERLRWASIDTNIYIQINIPSYTLTYQRPEASYKFKAVVGNTTAPTPTLNSNITYLTTFPEWKIAKQIFINQLLPNALRDTAYLENNHYVIYDRFNNYVKISRNQLLTIIKHPEQYYARQSSGCDYAMGQLVFHFKNVYDIYLHDSPEHQLFIPEERPFGRSCVRIENAWQLAEMLLTFEKDAAKMALFQKALKKHLTRNISLKRPVPIKVTYLTCEVAEGLVIDYKDVYDMDKSLEMALYPKNTTLTLKIHQNGKNIDSH